MPAAPPLTFNPLLHPPTRLLALAHPSHPPHTSVETQFSAAFLMRAIGQHQYWTCVHNKDVAGDAVADGAAAVERTKLVESMYQSSMGRDSGKQQAAAGGVELGPAVLPNVARGDEENGGVH